MNSLTIDSVHLATRRLGQVRERAPLVDEQEGRIEHKRSIALARRPHRLALTDEQQVLIQRKQRASALPRQRIKAKALVDRHADLQSGSALFDARE